jgi:peptidoglycan hydrolase-like protein with peptidoglycan-binding domain
VAIASALALLLLGCLVVGFLAWTPHGAEQSAAAAPSLSTARVTTGNLVSETRVPGTIQYADREAIASGLGGVVTELPAAGATLVAGSVAYRVDTRPVVVLGGSLPAWRDFASEMSDGDDVLQLEQNLTSFGFFTAEPDRRFTWDTNIAIRDWQKSLGLERTGVLERSMILFTDRDLRVDAVQTRVGSEVGPGTPVLQVSSVRQVVELNVKSADRAIAVVGAPVTVSLPTGVSVDGVVESVASPLSQPAADGTGGSAVVLPVRVSIADQEPLAGLALAGVTVGFAGAAGEDVLTVPVDALVPIDDTRFAVELPRKDPEDERRLLPVTVGAFSSGVVAIAGDGIVDGLTVVVPAR